MVSFVQFIGRWRIHLFFGCPPLSLSSFSLSGIVGIKDPARPGVAKSIDDCTKAGIRVIMITGDAKDTAIAIARDVNILPPTSEDDKDIKAFEGRVFFTKSEDEQLELLKTGNIVFCRAEPSDKQKLIKMLQSLNEISAMTGDGVNDAPALQQADIGECIFLLIGDKMSV